ncbi:zinc ribbon domain-containing protein [Geobacillus vulcani]|uniref:zinc ribbon domain-containing protein n=1 Tax=Geobacillus sp. BMUD TaxID=2508876 RepID=UPI001ED99D97|nr:zinc ribbon domain-containing protein [Geobacillus vulcani]
MLSRWEPRGKNRKKARLKAAWLHEKVKSAWLDLLHKLSSRLIRENQVIGPGESAGAKHAKEPPAGGKHRLRRLVGIPEAVGVQSEVVRSQVVIVSSVFPSSQLCSCCGHRNTGMKDLSVRQWTRPVCSETHERDVNVARNILYEGLRMLFA